MKPRTPLAGRVACVRIANGLRAAGVAGVLAFVTGCATGPNANPADPLEPLNRQVYRFNNALDDAVLKPAATVYVKVLPSPVRTGVNNFFGNLSDVWSFANSVAQLKLQDSAQTFMRLNVNTFFGLGGILDVATELGIDRHSEDFGQTLGRWGVGTGPYLFVPFYGPSDLRDGFGKVADSVGDPVSWSLGDITTTFGQVRAGVNVAQARVDIDDTLEGVRRDTADPYATLRSGYSQNRAFKIDQARGVSQAKQVEQLPDFGGEPPAGPPSKP